ncbi:type 2 isopentenyl-diphosphate Delta-isomerase [Peptoniphilaceae bacterium SGI.131]
MNKRRDLFIDNTLISSFKGDPLFGDIYIDHNSLPEISMDEISTETSFLGDRVPFPLLIDAMTGGTEKGVEINEMLYLIAQELKIPMEIGSQLDLMKDEELAELYLGEISRTNDETVLISNMSTLSDFKDIDRAMDLIHAKGIALHLNVGQELAAKDGSRDFRNILSSIEGHAKRYKDKLIVKEVGFGMSKKTVESLIKAGVKNIDVAGFGGTNFMEIENLRNYKYDFSELYGWGVPTAKSIINARSLSPDLYIIASGGIKNALDLVKALIIGADFVGISGELLKYLLLGGYDAGKHYLEDLMYKTRMIMCMLGARTIEDLKKVDYKVSGRLKDIL